MRTKIIATIGLASESKEIINKFVASGMDIARMNFSHCSYEKFLIYKKIIASAARKTGRKVLIMQDLQGPRIRVGVLPPEGKNLEEGSVAVFSANKKNTDAIYIESSPALYGDIRVGDPIYFANGDIEVITKRISTDRIFTEVSRGGILYSRKGINLPNTKLSNTGVTPKDVKDVKFAVSHGVDFIAISFVQTADDVKKLRKLAGNKIKIIAKIETKFALENIDSIIRASDAIMIARGDLGIEIPIENVPFIQKNLIRHANWHGKGTITATQMLTSMVSHERPTRADVSDIANAVWDGTDGVMLSDETASGKYPLASLKTMIRVVLQAEKSHFERPNPLAL
ncbi:MAG: pyruvate kinase [Candidatus Parcubacteria bacterium]|nr:pyruvate kinase [Candidatus Parcubacteria bacterium]